TSSLSTRKEASTEFETTTSIDKEPTINPKPGQNNSRTIKIALSVTFLVMAAFAAVVLIIYTLRVKRRRFRYDELALLP
ncbi:hypothetical protein TNIN_131581, partial [Trichonephila inaurata madagascariensis]